jgi:hypothetical protein
MLVLQVAYGATPVLHILSPTQKLMRTALYVVSTHCSSKDVPFLLGNDSGEHPDACKQLCKFMSILMAAG